MGNAARKFEVPLKTPTSRANACICSMCDVHRCLLSGAPLPKYDPSMPKGKVIMWNEENGSFHVYLNSDDDGQIRLNLGLGGGVQVQGGGKQPFQFSLGDKHQGPNSIN